MEKTRVSFNTGWRFALTEDTAAVLPEHDDSSWRRLDLPHDWQIENPRSESAPREQGFYPREGVGVYRLRFTAPEEWRGRTVRVLFDGVQRFSEIWLNGKKIGGRPYGYVPILCDMTYELVYGGENLLAVRADNRDLSGGKWVARGGDRWYSGTGIYRNVWLLVQDPTHIANDGVRITAEPSMRGPRGDVPDVEGIRCGSAKICASAEVEGGLEGCAVRFEIFSPEGERVYFEERAAEPVTVFETRLEAPMLWSPDKPYLYRAEIA